MTAVAVTGGERPSSLHVAIIMDGNGRWATARGLPRTMGHHRGAEAVRRTVRAAVELGVTHLTLFGFSSENWRRPQPEIEELMGLLRRYLRSEVAELHDGGVRLLVIGDRTRLAPDIVAMVEKAEELTRGNSRLTLSIALSYGARAEIAAAARAIARQAAEGSLDPDVVDEDVVAGQLLTSGVPDPDLVIRTSGEKRLSNFLLWQTAYSELVFLDTLWPDFSKADLDDALREYRRRERRYGAATA